MYSHLIRFIKEWYQTDGIIPLHEPRFNDIDKRYVVDAIDSTFVSSVGAYVNRFEQNLAGYLGVKYAVATVNGTAALQVALKLAGVEQNCEVITQPLTFVATANAIIYNNASPVFIDVDRRTLGLCPDALERFLENHTVKNTTGVFNKNTGKRIAAIVPMHTFGHPCSMDKIVQLADSWKIPVIEDAAEALGSRISNRYCSTFGLAGVLSFNGNKTITCGGGGAIITNDARMAQKAKHLTTTAKLNHKWNFFHDETGYNFRLPNLNAALACSQLERLENILLDKRRLAESYNALFTQNDEWGAFVTEPDACKSNYWLNAVITFDKDQRDELLKKTNDAGIMTRPAWALMVDLPIYSKYQQDSLENARWLVKRIVNLPSSARKKCLKKK
jgi:aminotransferase in exopolysaccharide biosynthesis